MRVFTQQKQFSGVARNHGIVKARGAYFVFLDVDDHFS
jgi:glycosyltransferase involved in cell wall biosynthesis